MSRIVLTGASGVLGTGFREMFPAHDFLSFEGDITDITSLRGFLASAGSYDALLHFAAIVPRRVVDADPLRAFNVNSMGTLNVLEASREARQLAGNPWIFFASTSHVYAPSNTPLGETALLKPHSVYGVSKLHAEQLCATYAENYALPICMGRIFSFSDSRQTEDFFIPATFRRVLNAPKGSKLAMPGLTSARDFLRVPQVCSAIDTLLKQRMQGVINIGTGVGVPLLSIVEKIAKSLGREDLIITPMEDPALQLTANTEKLETFGVHLDCEIDRLINEMAAFFKS